MSLNIDPRRPENVEHVALAEFNGEFGTKSDLSRYESIRSNQRVIASEIHYLNQLQMDSFIPTHTALLLKNNLHDKAFITFTTRSVLYNLKQQGAIGDGCFRFLHEKLEKHDFLSIYRYLTIVMHYSHVAKEHDTHCLHEAFAFQTPAYFSDHLCQSQGYVVGKEEMHLQLQTRKQFLQNWLEQIAAKSNFPQSAQNLVCNLSQQIRNENFEQFRSTFNELLQVLENTSDLEKICWEQLGHNLRLFKGKEFFDNAYLLLKTQNYYQYCLSRVTTLRESIERTDTHDLLNLSEKCKRAYNGCVYLLGDGKNMPAYSRMHFAALTGKMRVEWQKINQAFSRSHAAYAHRLCSCQAQMPASQNELAEWPYNSHPLIAINASEPIPFDHVGERGIDPREFAENTQKTIAVIGCKWGGGHMEIARGICNNLSSLGYHTVSLDLPEVLMSQDPVRNHFITRWLGKQWSKASLFLECHKHKAFALINFLRWLGNKFFSPGVSETSVQLILEQLLKIHPDAVAVDYSADNEALIKACEILGIPCLHVGADINCQIETRKTAPTYAHFKMSLPFNIPEVVNSVENTTTEQQRVFTGPPVKREFTLPRTHENILLLKEKWNIENNKKVVVISSGLAGGQSPYPELLVNKYAGKDASEIPIHLVVLCGKDNSEFKQYLEQNVVSKTQVPMTVLLHTNQMEELMSMASEGGVLIGKAGTSTIFESIVRGTRLLIDNVSPPLFSQGLRHFLITCLERCLRFFGFEKQVYWEKDNLDFTKARGLAEEFTDEDEFLEKFDQMLNNDNRPHPIDLEMLSVEREIPRYLREMIKRAETAEDTQVARAAHRNL